MTEIASMALDLLAGSVVFQIPHKPNAKLNIRMGFHRSVSHNNYRSIATPATLSDTLPQRPGHRRGGGDQDPELLRDVGHGDHGAGDREAGRGHEDTHQRDQQAPH